MAATSRASDATLAAAAGGGDAQAFAELYERHAGAIYGYCRRVLRSREEAADATHEAFVSVLETIRRARRPIVAPRPYLFRAAHNACLRIADSGKRFPRGEAPAEARDHGDLPEPERTVLTRELQQEVREANAQLPLRQREILALREVEHMDYQEIAQVMGITPNAAAQLAWRARANMRHRLRRRALTSIELHSLECQRALELLELADDAALSPDEDTWLARHFVACPRCASNRAILAEVGATYRSWVPAGAVPLLTVELLQRAGEVVAASWGTAAGGAGAVAAGGAAAAGGGAAGGAAAGGGAAAVATAAGAGTAAVSVPQAVVATAVSLAVAAGGGAAVGGGGPAGPERQAGLVAARPAPLVSQLQRRTPAPLPPASRIPLPAVAIPALPKTDAPPLSPEPPAPAAVPAVPAALAPEPPAPVPEAPAAPLITPAEDRPADEVAAVPPATEIVPAPPARPPADRPEQVVDEVLDKVRVPHVPAPAPEPPATTVEPAPEPEPALPQPELPQPPVPELPELPVELPVIERPDAPGRPLDLPDPPAAPPLPDLP